MPVSDFLTRLEGVADPEEKRRIVGDEFIRTFESQAALHGPFDFLAQGTLYPDVIESTAPDTKSAVKIKTHHNVGGLPADLTFSLVEPLRYLFKDEVREVGRALGLPSEIVDRQPFPGPGLAVRIIGEVTRDDLELLRHADAIVREEIDVLDDGARGLAVLRRPPARSHSRRHGRLPDLRSRLRGQGRHLGRRHDRRLGPPPLRGIGSNQQPHRERGPRHHASRLRHLIQATGDDRMGIGAACSRLIGPLTGTITS